MSSTSGVVVVADTSPFRYLLLIDYIDILPELFGQVLIPAAVAQEMSHPSAPSVLRAFASQPPSWLKIERTTVVLTLPRDLGAGETEAICLASELHADQIVLDDLAARTAANGKGLRVVGTLGLLIEAARLDLCDIDKALARLSRTSFRVSQDLVDRTRASVRENR